MSITPYLMSFSSLFIALSSFANTTNNTFLIDHLQDSENYLTTILTDVEDTHWNHQPKAGAWSIASCAEHILLAEQALLADAKRILATTEPVKKVTPQTDEAVLGIVYDRFNKKLKTVAPLEPKGIWKNKTAFLAEHKKFRQELKQFLLATDKDLSTYYKGSPVGEISLYQSFLVLSSHTARHVHQIETVKQTLGLKTATIHFGGNVKVNVGAEKRTAIQELFRKVLLLKVEEKQKFDLVQFDGGGRMAFVYHEDKAQLLAEADFAKSMQAGWLVPAAYFETIKRRLLAFGVKTYQPSSKIDTQKYFYFHVPGGQVIRLVKMKPQKESLEKRKQIAVNYFNAFHDGKLEEVFKYFSPNGTVTYSTQPSAPAKAFFPQSKDFIKTLNFQTHGVYTDPNSDKVILHFSFHPKANAQVKTEAIDIISFDEADKITNVTVIPNAKG